MKHTYLIILCLFTFGILSAQEENLSKAEKERREKNIQAGNPFAKYGYKAKVATLSKGKYLEVHDLDSIVTIGTIRWNVNQNKIVGNIVQDTTDMYAQPSGDTAGRWLSPDPLSDEFPEWSPYTAMNDNPVTFIDPDGRAVEDVIKIEKTTGEISVTAAPGNDVVQSVDNGVVQAEYTYGENGSFTKENTIVEGKFNNGKTDGVAVITNQNEKSEKFYDFAAKNSDVEFGRLVVEKGGNQVSITTTTHESGKVSNLFELATEASNRGFSGILQSHSHPNNLPGANVPSGYFGFSANNPSSLMPVPVGHSLYNKGDANQARAVRAIPGFGNTNFELYSIPNNTTTTYDGFNKAKIRPKN